MGNTQEIPQGEGGEQGDPLMPMLFSLVEHPVLEAIQRRLINGEKLAYLNDITVICSPERVRAVLTIIGEEFCSPCTGQHAPWEDTGVEPWRSHTRC